MLSLLLGALLGVILNLSPIQNIPGIYDTLTNGFLEVGGQLFLRLLQMLVVPVVFVSLTCGTASLNDIKSVGRVGTKAFSLFLLTTLVAVTLGCLFALVIQPGSGTSITSSLSFEPPASPPLTQMIIELIPKNPFQAFNEGQMLPIIVFSIFLGLAITQSGSSGKSILKILQELDTILMNLVNLVIAFSPIGVFCLIAKVFAEQGLDAVLPLGRYFFTVFLVLLIQLVFVYPIILIFFGRLDPRPFFRKFKKVILFGFSTASSNATLPVTLETVEQDLGVSNSIASFTVPLGATINMDGTAIMQGVATLFVAQAFGITLGLQQILVVIATATIASIGTAGVPGVGLVMLAMVFNQVGLPLEGIAMILAVDRPLDMLRTAVNISGDGVVSCVVAKSEKQINLTEYYKKA